MNVSSQLPRLLIGPPLLVFIMGVYRSASTAMALSDSWLRPFFQIFQFDLQVVALILLLCLLASFLQFPLFKFFIYIVIFLLTLLFVIDAALTLSLDERLIWHDIVRFLPEFGVVWSFLRFADYVFIVLFGGAFFLRIPLRRRALSLSILMLLLFGIIGLFARTSESDALEEYSYSVLNYQRVFPKKQEITSQLHYSEREVEKYTVRYNNLPLLELPKPFPNIILVIIESLSAVESVKVSGIRNRHIIFDELSEEGTLFNNFFSNYEASEGGIMSLLSGMPPIPFPLRNKVSL